MSSSSSSSPLAILPLSNTPRAYSPLTDGEVVYTSRLDKGKGRAVDYEHASEDADGHASYPPGNDQLEEERRIQETLAMYASKDLAVRRAKRESKMLARQSAHGAPAGAGAGGGKRSSWWGAFGLGGQRPREREREQLPFHTYSPTSPTHEISRIDSTTSSQYPYPTPYDLPSHRVQPAIQQQRRARTDSNATITNSNASPFGDEHAPPAALPSAAEYGYRGPDWRGGEPVLAGASSRANVESEAEDARTEQRRGPEKWWHALCAWGDDLDEGGRDGQAGRTNPFE